MISPPHVMLIMPGDLDQSVFSPDFESGAPWIMYAGTPYEHIMMPWQGDYSRRSGRTRVVAGWQGVAGSPVPTL